jgi:hypothetical protein
MFGDGILERRTEQGRGFGIGDAPADDAAAEDVENDVEMARSNETAKFPT